MTIETALGKRHVSEAVPEGEIWVFNPPPVVRLKITATAEEIAEQFSNYWTRLGPFTVEGKMPQKFRKKPVEVQAIRCTGTNFFEIANFIGHGDLTDDNILHTTDFPYIPTPLGDELARQGVWVVKYPNGDFYTYAPESFAEMFELVQ